jgi:asparagine synthase (glutamine-hydrolysing)
MGFPLIECRYDSATSMDRLLTLPRTVSPASYLTRDGCDPNEIDLARAHGATAIFTGIMGDTLFHMTPAAPSAADYIRARRFDSRFLAIVLQAAQLDRISVWTVLHNALMNGLFKPPMSFLPGEFRNPAGSLLTREACEAVYDVDSPRFLHPWLRELQGVPFGKFPLIGSLGWNSAYFGALREPMEPELIHPFFSEPLMELCLRLPSFSMLRDGWDRALVRQAFEPELPEMVRTRTSKGSPNLYVRERIEHNKAFIRDFLSDGILVKQGLLDRSKLVDCLPGQTTRSGTSLGRLWACVAAEAWSHAWSSRPAIAQDRLRNRFR